MDEMDEQISEYFQGIQDERNRIRAGINKMIDEWDENLSQGTVKMLIYIDGVVEGE
jgi:hypothetical protein